MCVDRLKLLDVTLPSAEENLAFDEVLLTLVEEQGTESYLRLWECPRDTVVVGRSSRVFEEVNQDACRRDKVSVLRRCSGGGVVLIGTGCLVFSLVLSTEIEQQLKCVTSVTAEILKRLVDALKPIAPGIQMCGTSDLALDGRKVSGNSQRWLRRTLLHHGTLLYDFAIERVSHYLELPQRQPEYRQCRAHDEFLTNLPIDGRQLRHLLIDAWQAREFELSVSLDLVAELASNKYGLDSWNLQR